MRAAVNAKNSRGETAFFLAVTHKKEEEEEEEEGLWFWVKWQR